MAIIYLGSGMGGNLASAIFVPYRGEVNFYKQTYFCSTISAKFLHFFDRFESYLVIFLKSVAGLFPGWSCWRPIWLAGLPYDRGVGCVANAPQTRASLTQTSGSCGVAAAARASSMGRQLGSHLWLCVWTTTFVGPAAVCDDWLGRLLEAQKTSASVVVLGRRSAFVLSARSNILSRASDRLPVV
jgi:hypothetical protein